MDFNQNNRPVGNNPQGNFQQRPVQGQQNAQDRPQGQSMQQRPAGQMQQQGNMQRPQGNMQRQQCNTQRPHGNMQMQQGNMQRQQGNMQRPQGSQQPQQGQYNQGYQQTPNGQFIQQPNQFQGNPQVQQQLQPKKKGGFGIVIVVIILIIAVIGGMLIVKKMSSNGGNTDVPVVQDYSTSGRFALDSFQSHLATFDAEAIDGIVGANPGDSYVAQEWAFVNGVVLREQFIQKVASLVRFEYPADSMMNAGEAMTVTVPDWSTLSIMLDEDSQYITNLYKSSGYSEDDYVFEEELFNLFCQYVVDRANIPTTSVNLSVNVTNGIIDTDASLDDVLFGSEEFHNACKRFSQICVGWTGQREEHYTEKEEQHNPEYDEWYAIFKAYYDADKGKFNPRKSKWEPWYLRDDNDKFVLDENGEKVVNYYSVKAEDGTDWIQPDENILVDVDKVRMVDDPWVEERGIPYCMVGTHFIQTAYNGSYSTAVRVGDGSRERPAGIGTSIITKVLCDDGQYHDVSVTLTGYWLKGDAIDYVEKFSAKNVGFSETSPVKLITFEFKVTNLEKESITFDSEMTLCDGNSNITSRTGTIYGLTSSATLKGGESIMMNDWASSTELEQKYLAWGKSFQRQYPLVFFDVLAGTGNVPVYSAYKQFTGESEVSSTP